MKVFISQPMKDKTNEQIEAERRLAIQAAKEKFGEDVEIIDSFFKDAPHGAKPLWFLGKSFEMLSTADAAIFCTGWRDARGCKMEKAACDNYGISAYDFTYSKDAKEGCLSQLA